jgi:flagellar motor switch protein FliN/FliY
MTTIEETTHLADAPIDLAVELDRRTMPVREIIAIEPGSVIPMTRSAGENVDILVDDTVIAFGEIVIIEEQMGIRLTDFRTEE